MRLEMVYTQEWEAVITNTDGWSDQKIQMPSSYANR